MGIWANRGQVAQPFCSSTSSLENADHKMRFIPPPINLAPLACKLCVTGSCLCSASHNRVGVFTGGFECTKNDPIAWQVLSVQMQLSLSSVPAMIPVLSMCKSVQTWENCALIYPASR